MDIAQFDKLTKRDFENGAVLSEIRQVLKENDRLRAELEEVKSHLKDTLALASRIAKQNVECEAECDRLRHEQDISNQEE